MCAITYYPHCNETDKPMPMLRTRIVAELCAVVLLAIVGLYQLNGVYQQNAHTWDEPAHLAAGMELLDQGRYDYEPKHPPLARGAIALGPYMGGSHSHGNPNIWQEGLHILYANNNYDQTLQRARLGVLPFFLLLLAVVWAWARTIGGTLCALVATFLVATQPVVIAHSSVATTDMPATALCLLGFFLLARWLPALSTPRCILLAAVTGMAIMAKFSAVPFLALGYGVIAAHFIWRGSLETRIELWRSLTAARIGLALLALFITTWAAHGFTWTNVTMQLQAGRPAVDLSLPAVIPSTWTGISDLIAHSARGHTSYLFGEVAEYGWWYFFPVAIAVKSTLPLLVLAGAGLVFALRDKTAIRRQAVTVIALLIATILLFCAFSSLNIGVRHVLLVYPLLALIAGYAASQCLAGGWPAKMAPVVLLAWQGVNAADAYPTPLSWFNTLGGEKPEEILVNSDLDWGQDLRKLGELAHSLNVPYLFIAYNGVAWFDRHGLPPSRILEPDKPATGWVAVSLLIRKTMPEYFWLEELQPVARAGVSIDLYFITPQDLPPAARAEAKMREALYVRYGLKDLSMAVQQFDEVLEILPNHYGALWQKASALEDNGQNEQALQAWTTLLALPHHHNNAATRAEIQGKINALRRSSEGS